MCFLWHDLFLNIEVLFMKLIASTTSPFARKIRVLLIEKGFGDIEVEMHNPWEASDELLSLNPLSRVPALVLTNGVVFYDSALIAEYIDSTMQGPKFVPEGGNRWFVLQAQAHADNMIDVGIRPLLERRRPPEKQVKDIIMRDELTIARSIGVAAKLVETMDPQLSLGHIAIACALGFVDFRLPHLKWRDRHPEFASWYQDMRLRPSMKATVPYEAEPVAIK